MEHRTHPLRTHSFMLAWMTTMTAMMMMRRNCGCAAFIRQTVLTTIDNRPSSSSSLDTIPPTMPRASSLHASNRRVSRTFLTRSQSTLTSSPITTTTTSSASNSSHRSSVLRLRFEDTPLGQNGTHLLDGLDHYTVESNDDGHPLAVYGISSTNPIQRNHTGKNGGTAPPLKPILLLHGRTWSSVPVYHLLGGSNCSAVTANPNNTHHDLQSQQHESRSLMEALMQRGLQPYCMDFRGFGGTPPDETGCVNPNRCVQDAESVLHWISARHGLVAAAAAAAHGDTSTSVSDELPSLLGWSQGALVAQLAAQKMHLALSKVILYGSIYDPLVRYPREPLYLSNPRNTTVIHNHYDAAIEDFTVEGTIPPEPARRFAEAALLSDPVKAVWTNLYQFNNCDPARVHVPCLVVAGDQDPYAPLHVQQELFGNLGRTSDRTWSIVSGSDHACHLLDGRFRLINTIVAFVLNGSQSRIQ